MIGFCFSPKGRKDKFFFLIHKSFESESVNETTINMKTLTSYFHLVIRATEEQHIIKIMFAIFAFLIL